METINTTQIIPFVNKKDDEPIPFDYEDKNDLHILISIINDNLYIKSLGNPNELDWDIDSLENIIKIIFAKFSYELRKINTLKLIGSLIFNVTCYSLVNNIKHISFAEIIKTFRYWDYLNFKLKSKILRTIMATYEIDRNETNFFQSKSPKENSKIIKFK